MQPTLEEEAMKICEAEGFHVEKLLERYGDNDYLFECTGGQIVIFYKGHVCPAPMDGQSNEHFFCI